MMRRALAAALVTAASVSLLAGCTAAAETDETTTPTPTATTAPQAVTEKCDDGFMLIDADQITPAKSDAIKADPAKAFHVVDTKCDSTSIVGSGAKIALNGTTTLTVEGNGNTVKLGPSTTSVRLAGTGNIVAYTAETAPAVDDKGTGNTVKKAAAK